MPTKILIIQTAFLGDAILTLPLIQAAYKKYENPSIDVICTPATKDIFDSSPYVNEIFILDKKKQHRSFIKTVQFALSIRKKNYGFLFSPHRSFRTSLIVMLSGAKNKSGFDIASLSFVYSKKIKYRKDFHEVRRNLSLLEDDYFMNNWKILPECKPETDGSFADLEISDEEKLIAVAPGSVWETKKYPDQYYAGVINGLSNQGYKIILIGGREDKDLCENIRKKTTVPEKVLNLAGKLSLMQSVSILKKCKLLICNDSAPTHLGMCADIPVLTLYCSTVADFGFYPYNGKSSFLSYDDLDCKPCGIHGRAKCPINTFDCGNKLLPSAVLNKANEILKKN